jgi:F0F1-type ATP synthase assembly protein I
MSDEINKFNNSMRYAGLATQWMVLLLVAVWLGYKLDYKWIGWNFPLFLILLPLIALGYSLWQVVREFNKPQNSGKKKNKDI